MGVQIGLSNSIKIITVLRLKKSFYVSLYFDRFHGKLSMWGVDFSDSEVNHINLIEDIIATPRKNKLNFKNMHHHFATIIFLSMMFV